MDERGFKRQDGGEMITVMVTIILRTCKVTARDRSICTGQGIWHQSVKWSYGFGAMVGC